MNPRLRAALVGLVWLAAANFAALVVIVLVLAATGAVDAPAWKAALSLLRGSSEAVPKKEIARLRKIEQAETERRGRPGELKIAESWRRLRERERKIEERKEQERDALKALVQAAELRLDGIKKTREAWKAEQDKAERERLRREEELEMAASEKVRRIYRHMRPEAIAADLSRRMAEGRTREAAASVDAMSDRTAAEVLEAVADPARRLEIFDAMAGRPEDGARP